MGKPSVQLLMFEGCPLADAARLALEDALAKIGLDDYEEIDILDPGTPEELSAWGSPTILVNGKDVGGNSKGDGVGCRIYPGPDRVPRSETIVAYVRYAAGTDGEAG